MRHTDGNIPIPDWAIPYVEALVALAALALLIAALRWSTRQTAPPKKRWGNTVGYLGGVVCVSTLFVASVFHLEFMPIPFTSFVTGFVIAGIGGSLAGWTR